MAALEIFPLLTKCPDGSDGWHELARGHDGLVAGNGEEVKQVRMHVRVAPTLPKSKL